MRVVLINCLLIGIFSNLSAQDIYLQGNITDTSKTPLKGVIVTLFESNLKDTTDENGFFTIKKLNSSIKKPTEYSADIDVKFLTFYNLKGQKIKIDYQNGTKFPNGLMVCRYKGVDAFKLIHSGNVQSLLRNNGSDESQKKHSILNKKSSVPGVLYTSFHGYSSTKTVLKSLISTVDITLYSSKSKLIPAEDSMFIMGSRDGDGSELPPHDVLFSHDFYMDSIEITREDFYSLFKFNFIPDFDTLPIDICWMGAAYYCNALSKRDGFDTVYSYTSISGEPPTCGGTGGLSLWNIEVNFEADGYRLPTEAEWEYACRAGTQTEYYWGDTVDSDYCWYEGNNSNGNIRPHRGAQKKPNAFGLYDMAGNLLEWCNDFFGDYTGGTVLDPTGPFNSENRYRVIRGGAYNSAADNLRSAIRNNSNPQFGAGGVSGFRCIRPLMHGF